jgi:hypothetical protein
MTAKVLWPTSMTPIDRLAPRWYGEGLKWQAPRLRSEASLRHFTWIAADSSERTDAKDKFPALGYSSPYKWDNLHIVPQGGSGG